MCFGGDDTDVQTVVQQNELPGFIQDAAQSNLSLAGDIANEPYQQYPGPRVAPFSDLQQQGFEGISSNVGSWQPGITRAGEAASQAMGANFPEAAETYMNPFLSNVIDQLTRQADIRRSQLGGQAAQAGAYGDTRHAVGESLNEEALQRNIGQLLAGGYGQAANIYAQDMNRTLGAGRLMGDLASERSELGYADIAAQLEGGGLQQQLGQSNLDVAYEDFLRQEADPIENLNILISALAGTPYETIQRETITEPTASPFQQILGLGATALGSYLGS